MTPAVAKAMYLRMIQRWGTTFTLMRGATSYPNIRGRIMMMFPGQATDVRFAQVTDTIGARRPTALLLAVDIETAAVPLPLRKGDLLVRADGKRFTITECDDVTRVVAGEIVAYQPILGG